jgi:hypothetical protein
MRRNVALLAMLASLVLLPHLAVAAPFCAVCSHGKQCYYYSMDACLRAAGDRCGCIINDAEAKRPSGGAPFCVVTSYATQCSYYDAGSCQRAAARAGGACAVNPNQ